MVSTRILSMAAAFMAFSAVGAEFKQIPGQQEFSGSMIARLKGETPLPSRHLGVGSLNLEVTRTIPETHEFVFKVPSGQTEDSMAKILMQTGRYQYVTPNWVLYPAYTPNDPFVTSQYMHTKMETFGAWDISTSNSSQVIALCDTGVMLSHEDLAPHLVSGYNSVDQLAQSLGGQVDDLNGHGTHTAGDAAAAGNNSLGIAGPAFRASIMPVRVSNSGAGNTTLEAILDGARWAADHGADVVSISYSGLGDPSIETTAQYVRSLGSMFFYAAGNNNLEKTFDTPYVIAVGNSTSSDARYQTSNYGHAVDFFAPGTSLLSTTWNGSYGGMTGTSMSTPVAAGVSLLVRDANPAATVDEVERWLKLGCEDLGDYGRDDVFGYGRVNARRSVILSKRSTDLRWDPTIGVIYEVVPANLNFAYASLEASQRTFFGLTGKLATFANQADFNRFTNPTGDFRNPGNVLIGARQADGSAEPAGGWGWIDSTPWTFTNWAAGYPANANNANVIQLQNGQFTDVPERETINTGFVVEFVSSPVNQSITIVLDDYVGNQNSVQIGVTQTNTFGSGLVLNSVLHGGLNSFSTSFRGQVDAGFKGSHWLRRNAGLTFDQNGVSLTVHLTNGDANDDNEIGLADFGILSSAFGSIQGDGNYDPRADFDGDLEVGLSDFGILSDNFGMIGD